MPSLLNIELPDELLQRLLLQSERSGKTPERLAADYLAEVIAVGEDPLIRLAGAAHSNVPDAAERNHDYLGQVLLDELQSRPNP